MEVGRAAAPGERVGAGPDPLAAAALDRVVGERCALGRSVGGHRQHLPVRVAVARHDRRAHHTRALRAGQSRHTGGAAAHDPDVGGGETDHLTAVMGDEQMVVLAAGGDRHQLVVVFHPGRDHGPRPALELAPLRALHETARRHGRDGGCPLGEGHGADDRGARAGAEQLRERSAALPHGRDRHVAHRDAVAAAVGVDEQQRVVGRGAHHRRERVLRVGVGRRCPSPRH